MYLNILFLGFFKNKYEVSPTLIGTILSHLVATVWKYENRKAAIKEETSLLALLCFLQLLQSMSLYFLAKTWLSSFSQSLSVDGGNFRNTADPEVAKFHWRRLICPEDFEFYTRLRFNTVNLPIDIELQW